MVKKLNEVARSASTSEREIAEGTIIYGASLGLGGLGMQAASALQSLAMTGEYICAFGPSAPRGYPPLSDVRHIRWINASRRCSNARIFKGRSQYVSDCEFGRMAAKHLSEESPKKCYGFTQISRESADWCRKRNVPFVLDNPNGHIKNFRAVYQRESWRWFSMPYLGHPTMAMVERVEEEYSLATQIRVSSNYSRNTMVRADVDPDKVEVIPQFVDLLRFRRPATRLFPKPNGSLRVSFVGSLDLRKGFVYLLRAIRKFGRNITLRIVGNTGDPWCKRLFLRESSGLNVELLPGDPLDTYHWSEVLVTPSLEDGFGFVVAEAMASGVPVIVSNQCGASEWIEHGKTGWVASFNEESSQLLEDTLFQCLHTALENRQQLAEMGHAALQAVSREIDKNGKRALANFWRNLIPPSFF